MSETRQRITFDVGWRYDPRGIEQMKKSLQEIQKMSVETFRHRGLDVSKDGSLLSDRQIQYRLNEAKTAAAEFEKLMSRAYNPDKKHFNATLLRESLTDPKLGINLSLIKKNFDALGITGQNAFEQIAGSMLSTNTQLTHTNKAVEKLGRTFGNTIRWTIAAGSVAALSGGILESIKYAQRLDNSLNDIRIVTGKGADEMRRFAEEANRAAKNLGSSTLDYTKSSLIFYQQGGQ